MSVAGATPDISVVMSVYNAERYLRDAVESILIQTFANFEFIIVDDGSTDGSLAILRGYERIDPRLRVISRSNKGLTVSLNEALAVARAPLVARMDADDVAVPTRFERQIAYLKTNPDVVLLGAAVELVDPYGIHIGNLTPPAGHEAIDASVLAGNGGAVVHPVCVFRTDTVRGLGGYREHFNNSEDLDLWLRLTEVGRAANLPDVLLKYRRDLGSVSHTKRDNQLRMKGRIVGEAYARRGLTPPTEWKFEHWMPKPHDVQLKEWGWRALAAGRLDAARGHARTWRRLQPFSLGAWRLTYCAWRGH